MNENNIQTLSQETLEFELAVVKHFGICAYKKGAKDATAAILCGELIGIGIGYLIMQKRKNKKS